MLCNRSGIVATFEKPPLYVDMPTRYGEHSRMCWRNGRPMPRRRSSINASEIFGTIERFGIDVRDQDGLKVNTGSCTMFSKKYANSFEIYSGTHTGRVLSIFRIRWCRFSAKTVVFRLDAFNQQIL
jgi:hypothetical protein